MYISGHYDTVNLRAAMAGVRPSTPGQQPAPNHDVDAPGANDDGSGTALTIELARVFAESGLDFDATLVFIAWAGEEQGSSAPWRTPRHSPTPRGGRGQLQQRHRRLVARWQRDHRRRGVKIYSLAPRIRCRGRWRATSRASPGSTSPRTPFASWHARIDSGAAAITPRSPPTTSPPSSFARPTRTIAASTPAMTRSRGWTSPIWRRTRESTPPAPPR
ncbi:MAG: M20/M25/M40 family metallo-hydrolase [Gemmatimonadetes bacterium]|nr:M20/M25/M40 family metallo-hydrolase [Gemmatimonadota bacterium]